MKPRAAGLLLLPTLACAVGPKYSPPQIPVPKSWNEATPTTANAESLARWWTEFQDPTLDRLVKNAVEGNLDLKIAAARIREARPALGISASAGLPQVEVNGAYARTQRSDAVPPLQVDARNQRPPSAKGSRTSSKQGSTPVTLIAVYKALGGGWSAEPPSS